jgi:hypothetical protein
MKYIKRFNENFNSIDMKNIKVVFDFYSNQDVIPRKIYITSKDEIKLGDGYLKLYDDGDVSETCFCDDLRFIGDGDLKVVATNDDFLIKNGVNRLDDNFLEWFDESDRTP